MPDAIKVDIISGFLGAGKTTLINKLLDEGLAAQKTALIENEFGDVAIDDDIVHAQDMEVTTLASGCICCTLRVDFAVALTEIAQRFAPERIIIEPTGMAGPEDVVRICSHDTGDIPFEINSIITVVNAEDVAEMIEFDLPVYNRQIDNARFVVLSRAHTLDPEARNEALDALYARLPQGVPVVLDDWNDLDGMELLALAEESLGDISSLEGVSAAQAYADGEAEASDHGHEHDDDHDHHDHHHHHHHDHEHAIDGITSVSIAPVRCFGQGDFDKLTLLLDEDSGLVLRAKGFVAAGDGARMLYEYVHGSASVQPCSYPGDAKMVIIGRDMDLSAVRSFMA